MKPLDDASFALLRLALTPGLGPVRIARCLETLGSPQAVLDASPAALQRIQGIGRQLAPQIAAARTASFDAAQRELDAARKLGAHFIFKGAPEYPPLLAELTDAPVMLMVRGRLDPLDLDRFPLGIVGSRKCTLYGLEQAERFASTSARAGLTIVSGGARGIDTAAHTGALKAAGRTIVVFGCGLAHTYPEENAQLFERIVEEDAGALVSEVPAHTAPSASNFPARNRIISGLSLGILVIEAGTRSGALITAQVAAEDHGREVMALPGRVDSEASRGTLELIRDSAAAPVIDPADVINTLENAARHHFEGTHEARFIPVAPQHEQLDLIDHNPLPAQGLQQRILEALDHPRSADQLAIALNVDVSALRSELTMLELTSRIRRAAGLFERIHHPRKNS